MLRDGSGKPKDEDKTASFGIGLRICLVQASCRTSQGLVLELLQVALCPWQSYKVAGWLRQCVCLLKALGRHVGGHKWKARPHVKRRAFRALKV